jgi:hypothetical protein
VNRAAAPADDHAAVAFSHVQAQDKLALGPIELLDPHGLRLGNEPLCEMKDELCGHVAG